MTDLISALLNPTPAMLDAFQSGFIEQLHLRHQCRHKPYDKLTDRQRESAEQAGMRAMLAVAFADEEPYPVEPNVKREMQFEGILLPCPACAAGNVFLTHTVRNLDARRHVECRICSMHGPVKTSTGDAVAAWNILPRGDR